MSVIVLASASVASAQTEEELAEARTLFGEGVEATQAERWDEAADRFRRVMQVRATGQVKYNLALALSHTGALAEAAGLLRDVVDDRELDRRTRRDARQLLDTIEPRLAHLTLRLQGDEAGLTITMDGAPLGLERVGTPMEVDPGAHSFALHRGEREVASRSVTVAEGESADVALVDTSVRGPIGGPASDEPVAAASPGGSVVEEWWFWTIIGAIVVVGVGIGVGVAVGSAGPSPVQGNLSPGVLEVMLP